MGFCTVLLLLKFYISFGKKMFKYLFLLLIGKCSEFSDNFFFDRMQIGYS